MENYINPESVAILFARVLLGLLFMIQGYDKVFSMGIKTVVQAIQPSYEKIRLPLFLIRFAAVFTSFSELIGGLLLIAGLFKFPVLILLGIDLLIVSIG